MVQRKLTAGSHLTAGTCSEIRENLSLYFRGHGSLVVMVTNTRSVAGSSSGPTKKLLTCARNVELLMNVESDEAQCPPVDVV
ncbi:hypothetical protein TNCV_4157341 [Trichonephila clavipes]|nr:hypothetical protein TNCV_4157341 [Trichonephila clavipes]